MGHEGGLEFVWRPSFEDSKGYEIFAHKLYVHYNPPGFAARLARSHVSFANLTREYLVDSTRSFVDSVIQGVLQVSFSVADLLSRGSTDIFSLLSFYYDLDAHGYTFEHAWYKYFDRYKRAYKTSNILVLWGDDFTHANSETSMENAKEVMRRLKAIDHDDQYDFYFSSISKYLDSVYRDAQSSEQTFNEYQHDFWKYDQNNETQNAYWTGYFSTYPLIKL